MRTTGLSSLAVDAEVVSAVTSWFPASAIAARVFSVFGSMLN